MEIWLPGILILLGLILAGFPIAFAMGTVGFFGVAIVRGYNPAFSMVGQVALETGLSYSLSVVPLFILMGNFIVRAGMADELYRTSFAWLGHMRGGLAMSTTVACGGFSAVCGSSLATAATMARVAMPSMRKYGYSDSLAAGTIAAGGTLGILIPPSVILVLYGIMSEQDIGKLFIAGIIPGVLGILGYLAAVRLSLWMRPGSEQMAPKLPLAERFASLKGVAWVLVLFLIVFGGIYGGVFTATEAAGIGAMGAFLIALIRGKLNFSGLYDVLMDTARTTAMIFMILMGALMFSRFVTLAGLPRDMEALLTGIEVAPIVIILLILLMYLILGAVLESLSMMLLTVPILLPVVASLATPLGFGSEAEALIWFGIVVVVAIEISLITPPVGLNVFVLKSVLRDIQTGEIFKGVVPFVLMDLVRVLLLVFLPVIVLFLPGQMG